MLLTTFDILAMLVVGLATGVLGGMVGLGGSVIMIPAMAVLFRSKPWADQHLFQATAMVMNVAVAVPAMLRHRRAGALRMDLIRLMLVPTVIMILVGVVVSNQFAGEFLERLFAVFLVYVCALLLRDIVRRRADKDPAGVIVTLPRAATVGGAMGFMGGLLGIGGGVVAVPLSQLLCRLPLRQAIAASSAVMGLTSAFGGALKVATLPEHGRQPVEALLLALVLCPTVVVGGFLGAGLTHRLPLGWVRGALMVLLLAAAAKMGGVV